MSNEEIGAGDSGDCSYNVIWRSNMKEELARFKKFLKGALFVTLDCEFSGIQAKEFDDLKLRKWDTPQERYSRAAASAQTYSMLQLGFSVFKWVCPEKRNSIVVKTWTMNLYPQVQFKWFDRRFTSQSSSLAFLAHNHFDFNKLFTMAVPYFSQEDEKECRTLHLQHLETKRLRESARAKSRKRVRAVQPRDKQFVVNAKQKIEALLKRLKEDPKATLELEAPNKFLRLLIYDTIEQEYPTLKHEKQQSSDPFDHSRATILISLLDKQTREEAEKLYRQQREEEFEQLVFDQKGLNLFIESIQDENVVVGVHNGLLDFLHVYSCTFAKPPPDLEEFKTSLMKQFPRIIDTKHIAFVDSMQPGSEFRKGTHLGECTRVTANWPGVELIGGVCIPKKSTPGRPPNGIKEHEAGYDAFLTGKVLIKFLVKLGAMDGSVIDPFSHENVRRRINTLHLMFSFTTLPFDPTRRNEWRRDLGDILILDMTEHVAITPLEETFNTYLDDDVLSVILHRAMDDDHKAFVKLPNCSPDRLREIGIHVALNHFPQIRKMWIYLDTVDRGEESDEVAFWHSNPPPFCAPGGGVVSFWKKKNVFSFQPITLYLLVSSLAFALGAVAGGAYSQRKLVG